VGAWVTVDAEDAHTHRPTLSIVGAIYAPNSLAGYRFCSPHLKRTEDDCPRVRGFGLADPSVQGPSDYPLRLSLLRRATRSPDSYLTMPAGAGWLGPLSDGPSPTIPNHRELPALARRLVAGSTFDTRCCTDAAPVEQRRLCRRGQSRPVYVPFGTQCMATSWRRLGRRPATLTVLPKALPNGPTLCFCAETCAQIVKLRRRKRDLPLPAVLGGCHRTTRVRSLRCEQNGASSPSFRISGHRVTLSRLRLYCYFLQNGV